MLTTWGEAFDPASPLPEYPRPQLVRDSWENLNGLWDYAITDLFGDPFDPQFVDDATSPPIKWDGKIVVPFSPEVPLSGVERTLLPSQVLWYQKTFCVTPLGDERLLLHFGAVDQTCSVAVNGKLVCTHSGGYLPFSADITDFVSTGRNTITVSVRDVSDSAWLTRGKQSLSRGGIWYTAQSGIWQTVWTERVPENYIQSITVSPLPDLESAEVYIGAKRGKVDLHINDAVFQIPVCQKTVIRLPGVQKWTPEDPHLISATAILGNDKVQTYFAMRSFEAKDKEFWLNNTPIVSVAALDQGYWPDGGYTAPSDDALVFDILTAKKLGFNTLRKHVKIEPLRWYHHCDRLGMMVWQDMPNGGRPPRKILLNSRVVAPFWLPDKPGPLLGRQDFDGLKSFLKETEDTIEHLKGTPSIVLWVPFNEGWGQFGATNMAKRVKKIDPSRPVDHASGWFDQGGGDVRSVHLYFRPPRFVGLGPAKDDPRVLALTEYGGFSLPIPNHVWNDQVFGYRSFSSRDSFENAFIKLHINELLPIVKRGLRGLVYTQLTDVEDEVNGLITYDRRVIKLDLNVCREALGKLAASMGASWKS